MLINGVQGSWQHFSGSFAEKEDKKRSVGVEEQTQGGESELQKHVWQPAQLQCGKG